MSKDIKLNAKNQDRLTKKASEIALTNPKNTNDLNYIIKLFSQAYLPYRKSDKKEKIIRNGNFEIQINTSSISLPYGSVPRILLAWMMTEAVQKKSQRINLGNNMRGFLKEIGLDNNGQKYKLVKDQIFRLLNTSFSLNFYDENDDYIREKGKRFFLINENDFWWNKRENQDTVFESYIRLSDEFFELCQSPIPIDKRALIYLKKSPLCLDIYFWLSPKIYQMKKLTLLTWKQLKNQFGSEYKDDKKGRYNFKVEFKRAFEEIDLLYPNHIYSALCAHHASYKVLLCLRKSSLTPEKSLLQVNPSCS